jgi:MFS family permease
MIWFSRHSYRGAFIFQATVGLIGNGFYGVATLFPNSVAPGVMLLARFVCGMEGSAVIPYNTALVRNTSGSHLVSAMSTFVFASSAGLIVGPGCSSISRQVANLIFGVGNVNPEMPPALLMITAIAPFLYFGLKYDGVNGPPPDERQVEQENKADDHTVAKGWLFFWLYTSMQLIRYVQRVFWEAAFLQLAAHAYGYGSIASGYLSTIPLLGNLAVLATASPLHKLLGTHGYVHFMDFFMALGIFLMWQIGPVAALSRTGQMAVLLTGSMFFYSGNWAQSVSFGALVKVYAVPGHPVLNLEDQGAWNRVGCFIGYFIGPVFAREVLTVCLTQEVLPAVLAASFCGWFIGQQTVMSVLNHDSGH